MREYETSTRASHVITLAMLVVLILLVLGAIVLTRGLKETIPTMNVDTTENEKDVYSEILRFHVRANSDSEEDQAVKLKVRDAVLEECRSIVTQNKNSNMNNHQGQKTMLTKMQTINLLEEHKEKLVKTAQNVLHQEGLKYGVNAYFTKEEFPIKQYGDMIFPAGTYDAFRIDLGGAKGHNWWCMLYPSLCFVDSTYAVVPDESKEELKEIICAEEFNELIANPDVKVEFKSALAQRASDWMKRLF